MSASICHRPVLVTILLLLVACEESPEELVVRLASRDPNELRQVSEDESRVQAFRLRGVHTLIQDGGSLDASPTDRRLNVQPRPAVPPETRLLTRRTERAIDEDARPTRVTPLHEVTREELRFRSKRLDFP